MIGTRLRQCTTYSDTRSPPNELLLSLALTKCGWTFAIIALPVHTTPAAPAPITPNSVI